MARSYKSENQVVREFWYFGFCYAAMTLNKVPGRLVLKLTTTFESIHNPKPYSKTWFELFSKVYFNNHIDNTESRFKLQAHILDGIIVSRNYK